LVISRWKSEFAANMSAVFKKSNSDEALEEYVASSKYLAYPKIKLSPAYLKTLRKSIEFDRFLLASTRNNQLKNIEKLIPNY